MRFQISLVDIIIHYRQANADPPSGTKCRGVLFLPVSLFRFVRRFVVCLISPLFRCCQSFTTSRSHTDALWRDWKDRVETLHGAYGSFKKKREFDDEISIGLDSLTGNVILIRYLCRQLSPLDSIREFSQLSH